MYEYECTRCSRHFERIEKVSGRHMKKCPKCGGKVERLVAAPAIQFKGSGWYVTDYARKEAAASDSKADESAKTAKPEKESKEPAAANEPKKAKKES
jgi:putative FmdB family regulatory protein